MRQGKATAYSIGGITTGALALYLAKRTLFFENGTIDDLVHRYLTGASIEERPLPPPLPQDAYDAVTCTTDDGYDITGHYTSGESDTAVVITQGKGMRKEHLTPSSHTAATTDTKPSR